MWGGGVQFVVVSKYIHTVLSVEETLASRGKFAYFVSRGAAYNTPKHRTPSSPVPPQRQPARHVPEKSYLFSCFSLSSLSKMSAVLYNLEGTPRDIDIAHLPSTKQLFFYQHGGHNPAAL